MATIANIVDIITGMPIYFVVKRKPIGLVTT